MTQETEIKSKAVEFALGILRQIPKEDAKAYEDHLTATLLLFMGAMWGFCGTEFTRGFIEAQLKSMEPGVEFDVFSPPSTH